MYVCAIQNVVKCTVTIHAALLDKAVCVGVDSECVLYLCVGIASKAGWLEGQGVLAIVSVPRVVFKFHCLSPLSIVA